MEYTRLGRSGLNVSRVGLRCMSYGQAASGMHRWALDEDAAAPFFAQAVELGVSLWDTANVLERAYRGPLGAATGSERLQIRVYDLLAHGWDLAQATGQPAELPDDVAEQSLAFVRTQLTEQGRPGRFGPAQAVDDHAPAVERLVAFLGRTVDTDP